MRVRSLALLALAPLAVFACNALNGSGDLSECTGAECDALGLPGRTDGGTDDDTGSSPILDSGRESSLPATCDGADKRCDGRIAAVCVNGKYVTNKCPDTCEAGGCVAHLSCRNANGTACPGGSCCETLDVAGGTFNRRNDTKIPATVTSFYLDRLEVTVARFRAFVAAGGATQAQPPAAGVGAHPKLGGASGWQGGWNTFLPADVAALQTSLANGTWTDQPGANELRAITKMSWFVAFAFCAWDGGRLPTYAELNYAGAGGNEQRVYPWSVPAISTTIDTTYASYDCAGTLPARSCPLSYCSNNVANKPCDALACSAGGGSCVNPPCTGCSNTLDVTTVGSYAKGKGRFGQLDLAGNVDEFVLDVAQDRKEDYVPMPCTDCALLPPPNPQIGGGPAATYFLVTPSNWFVSGTVSLRNNQRPNALRVDETIDDVRGIRCARD